MNIIRWLIVSFSLYSRIPMPKIIWKDEDMAHSLLFFPLVGVAIGAIEYVVYTVGMRLALPEICVMLLVGAIPLIVTGGFHVDGYMDVTDALSSYQTMDKKLEILKDPHIGAFAVTGLIKYLLIYGAGLAVVIDRGGKNAVCMLTVICILSRVLSGISSLKLKKARKSGMLVNETSNSGKIVITALTIWGIVSIVFGCFINPLQITFILIALMGSFLYYKNRMYKEFGGVTGDTAGYLVCISECMMMVALAVSVYLGNVF